MIETYRSYGAHLKIFLINSIDITPRWGWEIMRVKILNGLFSSVGALMLEEERIIEQNLAP